MTETIGIIGCLLIFIKVALHLYLMAKVKDNFVKGAISPYSSERMQLFFLFSEDAPEGYKWLKKTINVMYAGAILCIVIFLVGENTK